MPEALKGKLFAVAKLSLEQAKKYKDSLKYYQDIKKYIDTVVKKEAALGVFVISLTWAR